MATLFYFPRKLDYDDYQLGSPGPSFVNLEDAVRHMADHGYYTDIGYSHIWESDQEYADYMAGTYDPPRPDPRVHSMNEFFTLNPQTGQKVLREAFTK